MKCHISSVSLMLATANKYLVFNQISRYNEKREVRPCIEYLLTERIKLIKIFCI